MTHIQTLWARAEAHAARRDWSMARATFQEILGLEPGSPRVLLQLSYIDSLAGRYRSARQSALLAAQAKPKDERTLRELMARLRTFNEAELIHECIDRLPALDRVGIPTLMSFAAQLSYLNEQAKALLFLDEAKRGDPDFPPVLLARAQVLIYLGRFEEAETDLRRAQARAPEIAQTYWLLSRIHKLGMQSDIDAIRVQASRPGRSADEAALLAYALHKELDDAGDHVGAWDALLDACRAKRSTLSYNSKDTELLVSQLMALPSSPISRPPAEVRGNERVPIFIVGMHRSGTTLLEQLLAGHGNVIGIGELYDFTSQMRNATDHHCRGVIDSTIVERTKGIDFDDVGRKYLAGLEWRLQAERYFTDKLPSNFFNVGFICRALPQAKIIHMARDPVEICFSNLRELFSDANPYSYDQLELASFHKQYRRLMDHWHSSCPGRILDVDYATLTTDTEGTLRRVTEFCGLGFEPSMLDMQSHRRGIGTASAVQVRDKVIVREKPKWAPYETQLQPLIKALSTD